MIRLKNGIQTALLSLIGCGIQSWGQADYMPPMSGWPAAIQTAWQIQGEYYGGSGTQALGAWVIANGGTNFGLVLLPGGLLSIPGQQYGGWNGTTRYQGTNGPAAGTLNGKVFNVTVSSGYVADSITGAGETRSLYVHNGATAFVLQRVRRQSPTFGLRYTQATSLPGGGGIVSLWDSATGTADLSKWQTRDNAPAVRYGYFYRGPQSVATFGTHFLHIEYLCSFNPTATGQGRSNSGIYLQSHYEAQVLDNFGLSGAIDEFGSVYTVRAPIVNAALPPQVTRNTYDIYFTPRTSGAWGDAAGAALMTVYANGVLVQNATPVPSVTTAGSTTPGALQPGPLYLQNHNNEVVFTNIWAIPNATVTSLPYTSILSLVGATPIRKEHAFAPMVHKSGLELIGITGGHNLLGRKIRTNGSKLSIQAFEEIPKP